MDPITAAILAIVTASATEVGKAGLLDAYNALKSLLSQKFGHQSKVVKAVQDLEADPSSKARVGVLQEEVAKVGADKDAALLQPAHFILQQTRYSQSMQSYIHNRGHDNTFQIAGGSIQTIHGRPGLIAFVAIVLVAIFAFLIWQISPSLRSIVVQVIGSTPTPTPSYTRTPDETLTNFCTLVRANGSDYAYKLLYSAHLRQQITPTQFDDEWSFVKKPLSSCIGTIVSSSTNQANGTIADTNFQTNVNETYNVTLIKEDGGWKIDSMQKQ